MQGEEGTATGLGAGQLGREQSWRQNKNTGRQITRQMGRRGDRNRNMRLALGIKRREILDVRSQCTKKIWWATKENRLKHMQTNEKQFEIMRNRRADTQGNYKQVPTMKLELRLIMT